MVVAERVLVLAAHPDDETIGAGATIARWADEGHEVFVWFATDGASSREEMPESAGSRRARAEAALSILGVAASFYADWPDNALDGVTRLEIAKSMEAVVNDVRPTRILTHSQADLNIDHRIVSECAAVVARPTPGQSVRSVWHFEVASSTGWFVNDGRPFAPSHFVNVNGYMERKSSALRKYGSEIPPSPHARSIDSLLALARIRGGQCGVRDAEAFECSLSVV